MKLTLWDILAVLALVATAGIIIVYGTLFINPHTSINLFPPPDMPTQLVLPTSTSTLRSLPQTWTPTPLDGVPAEVKPSGTPIPSNTPVILPSGTITLVPTNTVTRTPTRTSTSRYTRTATKTPTRTRTKTLRYTYTPTSTKVAANPDSAVEKHGATTNTWQKSVSDPSFSWKSMSGAKGYYIYFGPEAGGTSTQLLTKAAYNPSAVTSGTYYLRISTKYSSRQADWATIFVFRYDNSAPSAPVSASTSGSSVPNNVWQNWASKPDFTWSGASDTGSGIDRYDIYYGADSGGETVTATTNTLPWVSPKVNDGTWFLRVRSVDKLDNTSGWASLFTLRFDGSEPTRPSGITITGPLTITYPTPTFTWHVSSDALSGVCNYDVYWGSSSNASSATSTVPADTNVYQVPAISKGTQGTKYFRVRAVDCAGNNSEWSSAYAYAYNIPLKSSSASPP